MHAYILLDRTGSMSGLWDEALSSVNAYAQALADDSDGEKVDARVTLAVFDAQDGLQFDVLRKGVRAAEWRNVAPDEASPRGMTPLFDAVARLVSLAEADAVKEAVLVIMTDGQENASREVTREGAKAAIDRAKAKGWETVFLGANFGDFADADAIGVASGAQMAMAPGAYTTSMRRMSQKSRDYFAKKMGMEFNEDDRAEAKEANVRKPKS
ncbi:VWA domain-containing protein [bacterium]|nr:VWA domain-containing protein [bacterium]